MNEFFTYVYRALTIDFQFIKSSDNCVPSSDNFSFENCIQSSDNRARVIFVCMLGITGQDNYVYRAVTIFLFENCIQSSDSNEPQLFTE